MAPDAHTAIWTQWHRHVAFLSAFDGVGFGDLLGSHVAALHEADLARVLSERYLLPLDHLDIRLAQRVVDARFPDGAALVRLENDGTVSYVQALARIPVIAVTGDEIVFETEYPAGPFVHHVTRAAWADHDAPLVIPDPDGDGSRVITSDLSDYNLNDVDRTVAEQLRNELPRLAAELMSTSTVVDSTGPPSRQLVSTGVAPTCRGASRYPESLCPGLKLAKTRCQSVRLRGSRTITGVSVDRRTASASSLGSTATQRCRRRPRSSPPLASADRARLLVRRSNDGVRVRLEVAPPRGMALVPALPRGRDEIRAVFEVADDDAALVPGLPTDGSEAQHAPPALLDVVHRNRPPLSRYSAR